MIPCTFQVFAANAPVELGGKEQLIAELVLNSHLTTSRWGDTGLLFRHQGWYNLLPNFRLHFLYLIYILLSAQTCNHKYQLNLELIPPAIKVQNSCSEMLRVDLSF